LIGCGITSGCSHDQQIEVRDPFRDAMRPQINRLAECAVYLAAQFERRAVTQEAVGCVVAVARNQVEVLKAVTVDA